MDPGSKIVTIKEAAVMLGVTPLTLRNWDKNGKLIASRHPLNNYRVYRREDIEKLIESIATNKVSPRNSSKKTRKLEVKHLAADRPDLQIEP